MVERKRLGAPIVTGVKEALGLPWKIAVRKDADNRATERTSRGNAFVHIEMEVFVNGWDTAGEHGRFPPRARSSSVGDPRLRTFVAFW